VFAKFGDTDGDGDIDQLYTLGGRGISIFRQEEDGTITKVRETGGEFEAIIARDYAAIFNQNQGSGFDTRSDDKGPEPEGVTVGEVDGHLYAFVALERTGGVMVYDVTDPENANFVQYVPPVGGQDDGPEVITFVSADHSPTGQPLVLSANEISGTVSVYQIAVQAPGDKGDNYLSGSAGADVMHGGPGADTLIGGLGADILHGESGADVFLFTQLADGGDTLTGFARGDRIGILRSGFGLAADADFSHGVGLIAEKSPTATDAGPTFLYDKKGGDLYFDADGSGAHAPVLLAHINGQPLTNGDFVFI
jgi:Ca2+-binding RTX toxin-like protein